MFNRLGQEFTSRGLVSRPEQGRRKGMNTAFYCLAFWPPGPNLSRRTLLETTQTQVFLNDPGKFASIVLSYDEEQRPFREP